MVQGGGAVEWGDSRHRQTNGQCGLTSHRIEGRDKIRPISSGLESSGLVGLGGERDLVAFVVKNIRHRWNAGVWD